MFKEFVRSVVAFSILLPILGALHLAGVNGQEKKPTVDEDQSVMFEALLTKRIIDLKVGESAFTAPEALVVDESKKCWLHPYYITTDQDTKFKVTKEKNGFAVEINDSKMRWSRVDLETGEAVEKNLKKILVPVRALKASK